MSLNCFEAHGWRTLKRTLRRKMCLVLGAVVAGSTSSQSINLLESTNTLMFARNLNRSYVDPLGMPGKPATYALATMLAEGFRCDLRLVSPIGLDEPPLADCFKSPSGFGPQCEHLYVTVRFERQPQMKSREELIQRLDAVPVRSALAFCGHADEVSADYLTGREQAERALANQVSALALPGNAKVAHEKLLMQNYYCGFATDSVDPTAGSSGPRPMVCTRWRTGIRYCWEAKLTMDVDWPAGVTSIRQLYGALPHAQVTSVRSGCEVPKVRAGGRPM